jgi:DNA-binding NarL/FixJ family response regulator
MTGPAAIPTTTTIAPWRGSGTPYGPDASADVNSSPAQPERRVSDTLTPRERDVLAMIGQGFANKRIARSLRISPETVKSHVKRIFSKLAVSTRTESAFRARSLGLL